ncbi:methylenetetrahydrofolate reductase [Dipodascopsis tothii]|uniref:methylenetetrahydrofolate reductase n=1 Tax=Dipodascopsis tothii TaxID=44089 RepID=UPI0034CD748A
MRVTNILNQNRETGTASFSFEYFVPKTSQGVQNLYERMDRMRDLQPLFIDITWNAGGSKSDNLTTELVAKSHSKFGLNTCMHLTCADMSHEVIDQALKEAYTGGCRSILALRGDAPTDNEKWDGAAGEFRYARDLVAYIREKYGDHFEIGVAGYPEGHPEEADADVMIAHLKDKVDAGASFVITQMFYDVDNFLSWVDRCRAAGIAVPIVPGIMPITSYASFLRRATWCQVNVPKPFLAALEAVKDDDNAVKDVGNQLVFDMCERILAAGIYHLHFYTMNLEKSTRAVVERLGLAPAHLRA